MKTLIFRSACRAFLVLLTVLLLVSSLNRVAWAEQEGLEAAIKGIKPSSKTRAYIKAFCRYLGEDGYLGHLNQLLQDRDVLLSKYFKYWRPLCKRSRKARSSSSNFKAGLPSAKLLQSSHYLCESFAKDFAENQLINRIVVETLINHFATANSSYPLVLNEHLKGCIPESLPNEDEQLLDERSLEEIF